MPFTEIPIYTGDLPQGGQTYEAYGKNVDDYVVYFQNAIEEYLNPFIVDFNSLYQSSSLFSLTAEQLESLVNGIDTIEIKTNNLSTAIGDIEAKITAINSYLDTKTDEFDTKLSSFNGAITDFNIKYGLFEPLLNDSNFIARLDGLEEDFLIQDIKCLLSQAGCTKSLEVQLYLTI
jgi:hypothetical protein